MLALVEGEALAGRVDEAAGVALEDAPTLLEGVGLAESAGEGVGESELVAKGEGEPLTEGVGMSEGEEVGTFEGEAEALYEQLDASGNLVPAVGQMDVHKQMLGVVSPGVGQ